MCYIILSFNGDNYMRELTTAAKAAKAIRKELKEAFPSIKFSVTSKNFSMGNSIDVDWMTGPTSKEVEAIINKYQYGHFNGMEDIYEHSNSREDIPQAKYVTANRSFRDESEKDYNVFNEKWDKEETLQHKAMRQFCTLFNIEYAGPLTKVWDNSTETIQQITRSIFNKSSLMSGYHGIKKTGKDCGLIEDMYCMY